MRYLGWLKVACIGCTAASLGVAANTLLGDPSRPRTDAPAIGAAPEAALGPLANADSLARLIAARDPFRAARAPAAAPFNPDLAGAAAPPPAAAPRPALSLAGVMLGSEPSALIDGLPGSDGTRVLRVEERVGDFLVRSIAPDQVVIVGRDTTWTLKVRTRFQ